MVVSTALLAVYESSQGQAQPLIPPTVEEAMAEAMTPSNSEQMAEMAELPCVISRFDPIMRRVGGEEGLDWRLMSAIA